MKRSTPAFFFSTSLLLLFFLTTTTLTSGVLGRSHNKSCASSCGVLDDIHYPFRLQGDPRSCGKPEFELICESGKDAVLHNFSPTDKYLVTQISYNESLFRLVYAGYATGSNNKCVLPSAPFPLNTLIQMSLWRFSLIEDAYGEYYMFSWASFMSCKQEIHSDLYKPVHCLTGENNSATTTYVIVDYDAYEIRYLKNSCRFVNLLPVDRDYSYNYSGIFELLARGVWVRWDSTTFNIFESCWKRSWSLAYYYSGDLKSPYSRILVLPFGELLFLGCVYLSESAFNNNHVIFGFTVVLVLALDIALCLLVGRFVIAPLLIYAFLAYNYWKTIRKPIDSVEKFLKIQQTLTPTRYAYSDIIAMTSHFREKLGQGGFGSVYRGYILGKFPVAVKMLVGSSKFHGEDFISEVSTIGMIHHINVVRLVGFCAEGSKRALIYEYMPNGSLDKYIFSANGRNTFTVEKLHEVALGIARGINYLHQGCDMQILHFDIKPHNILLDRNFIPKISDFGLAKLYPKDKNLISMSVTRGTIGYIAPELISRNFGIISDKSDVYSFGMLLMEMAGGRHNVDVRAENTSQVYYPSWIYDKLVDQLHVSESSHEIEEIVISEMERKLSMVGLWCIQIKSSSRPSMNRVVEMLEGDVNELQMPPKPFFSSLEPSLRELEFSSTISSSGEELHDQQHTLRPNYSGLASSSIQLSVISEHS